MRLYLYVPIAAPVDFTVDAATKRMHRDRDTGQCSSVQGADEIPDWDGSAREDETVSWM